MTNSNALMTNITQSVWNILTQDLSIQKNLKRNLINIRALAKYIIREYQLKASIDSVISAIRRYSSNSSFYDNLHSVGSIFLNADIATKNNLVCLVLRQQSNIRQYLDQVSKITDFEKRDTLRIIKGKKNMKIITDMVHLKKLKEFFSNEEDLEFKDNLSEIRMTLAGKKADYTKGVAARIVNELLTNQVNINEIIFCVPEIIIYVDQKDLLKAHESIVKLSRGN